MLNAQFATTAQIETLTRLNLQDMLDNFGMGSLQRGRGAIERLFWFPSQLLAKQLARFDARVGEIGLQASARELLARYINRLDIVGAENIPARGGVIFAANHPGMTDTLACFSSIPRADLRTVSMDRPFVRAMPHVAQRVFYVSETSGQRSAVVRQIARYLQKGGAVLVCPAGHIEPDPAVMPGAITSLADWSSSLGLFVQLAPASIVVPTVVSGVVYGPTLTNPLTRVRRTHKERERVAATIQAFLHSTGRIQKRMNVRVEFGAPLSARELRACGTLADITHRITDAVKPLLERAASPPA
jgi:hypothetical protein